MADQYIGVGGIARKVKNEYVGVNGIARKTKAGYVGVNGIARKFYPGHVWKKYNYGWIESLGSKERGMAIRSGQEMTYYTKYNPETDKPENARTIQLRSNPNNWRDVQSALLGRYTYWGSYGLGKVIRSDGWDQNEGHLYMYYKVVDRVQGKTTYIGEVSASDENAYPADGLHTDGYWYVKQSV